MKRLFRHACAMLAVFLVMSLFTVVNASAANGTTIDTTNAKYGFVTVNYTSNAILKVGIQYGSEKVSYKNCPSGKDAIFSLEQGDGTYTIFLCENISGTMERVENMMGTIVTAFERQLDGLFGDQALDISTDITVLENMMAREGLSDDPIHRTQSEQTDSDDKSSGGIQLEL